MHKRIIEDVETGAGDPSVIQRRCLSVQGWGQESQSSPEAERGKAGEGQHEGFMGLPAVKESVEEMWSHH